MGFQIDNNVNIQNIKDLLAQQDKIDAKKTVADVGAVFYESSDEQAIEVKYGVQERNKKDSNRSTGLKSAKELEDNGLSRHMIAAKDGPYKGSKYYPSDLYDAFGNYKPKR